MLMESEGQQTRKPFLHDCIFDRERTAEKAKKMKELSRLADGQYQKIEKYRGFETISPLNIT